MAGLGATSPTAAATVAPPSDAAIASPGMPEEVLAEYRQHHPNVPVDVLYARLSLAPARKALLNRFAKDYAKTFGGSWYDLDSGVWNLYATSAADAAAMARDARAAGIVPSARVVRYDLRSLYARSERISNGKDPMSRVSRFAGVDVLANRVTVAAAKSRRTLHDPMVTYVDPVGRERMNRTQACNTRRDCGVPLRTGIVLWQNGDYKNPHCSLGFVALGSDGSKWVLTAGHCFVGTDTTKNWGNGSSYLGTPGYCWWVGGTGQGCFSTTNADVGRIHILNSAWNAGGYGYVYNPTGPNSPVDVTDALTSRSQLEIGEVACLNAWHISQPGDYSDIGLPGKEAEYEHVSDDRCGTISSLSSANDYQMVVVNSVDTCGGDSGGGWTVYPGGTVRMAAGIHNGVGSQEPAPDPGPPPACNQGLYARFTPLDVVNAKLDSVSGTTIIRVITR